MGEVIELDIDTTLDIPPVKVCEAAMHADLSSVMVIGWDKAGQFYMASSSGDIGELLIMLELGKRETVAQI